MGKDNQPKHRQASDLARKKARRASYDRVLIVTEGSKTEPNYFNDIRTANRIHAANVQVVPSTYGTEPIQIVEYAESLFLNGEQSKNIQPKAFEEVYVVFDRDDHKTYHNALLKIESLNLRFKNDNSQKVAFKAIASVPCFELWLLLHFEDVQAVIQRDEVYERLRRYIAGYLKGGTGHYAMTLPHIEMARARSASLCQINNEHEGTQPFTNVYELVNKLSQLNQ